MKPTKRISGLAAAVLLAALPAAAQLSGNVSVEGEYLPLVIETERINVLPGVVRYNPAIPDINYEFIGKVTDFRPDLLTMGATPLLPRGPVYRRGFIDLRLGSWLDSRLHAGLNLLNDSSQALTAELKFRSSSLWTTTGIPDSYTPAAKKKLYDGKLRLNYLKTFSGDDLLDAAAYYRLAYFNYYGSALPIAAAAPATELAYIPTQTVNQGGAALDYSSSSSRLEGWHAGAGVDYTGFRTLYSPLPALAQEKGDHETVLRLSGGIGIPFADVNAVAVNADARFLFCMRNYGVISLRPAYRFANSRLAINAGIDLGITYDAMGTTPANDFGAIHVAPDIKVDYALPQVGLFLHATGGVTPATLADGLKADLYRLPALLSTTPIYTPLDLEAGVNVGPFYGFSAQLAFRYAAARNVPLGGWYQAYLGAALPAPSQFDAALYTDPYLQAANLHGCGVGLTLDYALGTRFGVNFKGEFTPQNGHTGIFNGFDRPRWVLDAKIWGRPLAKLLLEAEFDYRAGRACYAWAPTDDLPVLEAYRLGAIPNLKARITYSVLSNLDIYCNAENILNRHPQLIPGLRMQGVTIQGGVYVRF